MRSISERQQQSAMVNFGHSEDRISNLPDSILCSILSFLPTKYVVATSMLSSRWKNLWTFVPNLEFDDTLLFHHQSTFNNLSFTDFVNKVLLLLDVPRIQKFHLELSKDYHSVLLSSWISEIIKHKVQELVFCNHARQIQELPLNQFRCETIVILRLSGRIYLKPPNFDPLPSLKILHLEAVVFSDNFSISMFFMNCLVLEDLVLTECNRSDVPDFCVCAPVLKRLTMHFVNKKDNNRYKLVFNCPTLESLHLIDPVSEEFVIKDLSSLVLVEVDVARHRNVCKLFKGISHVRHLSIYQESIELISLDDDHELPMFHNVTYMMLRVEGYHGWLSLPNILESFPNLEELVLNEFEFTLSLSLRHLPLNWSPPECTPHCLLNCLQKIEITMKSFKPLKNVLKLIVYFLKNAKVLKKMTIACPCLKEYVKIQETLLEYLKEEKLICQLDFHYISPQRMKSCSGAW